MSPITTRKHLTSTNLIKANMASKTQHPPISPALSLTSLPVELIEKTYIYSENLALPLVNRFLRLVLNKDIVRIQLCSFAFGRSFTYKTDHAHPSSSRVGTYYGNDIVELQSQLLRQIWFTASFARHLEATVPVLQRRAEKRKEDHGLQVAGRLRTSYVSEVAAPWFWFDSHVLMPKKMLSGTWTEEKVELFYRMRGWYVEPPCNTHLLELGREQAILDGNGTSGQVAQSVSGGCRILPQ